MRLSNRILEAVVEMSAHVEAGGVEDYCSYDNADTRKQYAAALDAGLWARQVLRKRKEKKAKRAERSR
jgi:hypothetical protein